MPQHPYLVEFRLELEFANYSRSTVTNYVRAIERFAESGVEPLTATKPDVKAFVLQRTREVSPFAGEAFFKAARCFYKWRASEFGVEDPTAGLRRPKVPEAPARTVTEQQFQQLVGSIRKDTAFLGQRDLALIVLFHETGMRRGELSAMTLENVDVRSRQILLPKTKNGQPRIVSFGEKADLVIRRYLIHRRIHPNAGAPSKPVSRYWSFRPSPGMGEGRHTLLASSLAPPRRSQPDTPLDVDNTTIVAPCIDPFFFH